MTTSNNEKSNKEESIDIQDNKLQQESIPEDNALRKMPCNIYLAYFDNYAAYHFMAQFSIMPTLAMESLHNKETFSTQVKNVILCSAKPIDDNVFIKSDDRFQVVFEIKLENLPDQHDQKIALIKDEDFDMVEINGYKVTDEISDFLAINFIIPIKAIGDILVKSEEDRNIFINRIVSNVPFQHFENRIKVKPEMFGDEKSSLTETILSKISEIPFNDKYIKYINHMRAALLASLQSSKFPVTKSIATSYDKKMINILSSNIGHDNLKKYYDNIRDKVARKCIATGYKPLTNILDEDESPISEFIWFNKHIQGLADGNAKGNKKEPDFLEGLYENAKSSEALLDIYSFRVLCWLLIDIEDYTPISFIDQFKEEFNHNISNLQLSEDFNLNHMVETYNSHFEKLKKNLEGTGLTASNTKQQDYSTLIALNHFGMSYEPTDHFSSLVKYLQSKQQINKYHKRIIWFLYGLCYGMHKVNNDFKKSINDMAIIDNLLFYQNTPIPNLKPGNNEFIVENDGLHVIYTVLNEYGDLEDMINELSSRDLSKLENILLDLESVPKDYKCFLLEWDEKDTIDYILCKKTLSKLILKQEPTIKKKINWEEFEVEGFIAQTNTDDKKSLSLVLANLLYG